MTADSETSKGNAGVDASHKKDGEAPVVAAETSEKNVESTASSTSSDTTNPINTPTTTEEDSAAEAGMECGFKNLYSGPEDKRGRYHWVDKIPSDLSGPVENAETAKWALIVRYVKVYNDPRRVLRMHSIVVQSPLLKKLLSKVLKDYPGVTTSLQRLQFSGKFEPLIHRWTELQKAITDEEDQATKEHAQLLYDVLSKEFKNDIEESLDMRKNRVISYELLWTLFQPGDVIYSRRDGHECAFRLVDSVYGVDCHDNPVFWTNCQYVEWDGSQFGTQKASIAIGAYSGTNQITRLSAFPLSFHVKSTEVQERLIKRGGEAEKLSGAHYKAYNGVGWRKGQWGQKEKFHVKGRIMIDTSMWNRFNTNQRIYTTNFAKSGNAFRQYTSDAADDGHGGDDDDDDDDNSENDSEDDDDDDAYSYASDDGYTASDDEHDSKAKALTRDQHLICTPLLRGYALNMKRWLNFSVNCVQEIAFNQFAFDRLVLPENQKDLILGFTETQRSTKKNCLDDVIEGKGKGIVLLLSGPPGVGKTLTAESVAEEMKAPLYLMSAGDLGLDSRSVESRLSEVLEMCTKWNAVLLIDEADVFLEERSLHELERNKLVSIFLRVLEYYEGIMFLTTNRVQTFDAAFQSRIHISLEYPQLNGESRRLVWKNFLNRPVTMKKGEEANKTADRSTVEDHCINDVQLDLLSNMELNGRQIKNVLKTATLLASRRQQKLSYEHIMNVLDVTQHLHNATKETDRQRSAIFC